MIDMIGFQCLVINKSHDVPRPKSRFFPPEEKKLLRSANSIVPTLGLVACLKHRLAGLATV